MYKALSLWVMIFYVCLAWPSSALADDVEWHPGGLWCTASYYNHLIINGSLSQTATLVGSSGSGLSGFGSISFKPRYRPNCNCGICLTVHFKGNGKLNSRSVTLSGPNGSTVKVLVSVTRTSNVSVSNNANEVNWGYETRVAGKDWTEWDGGTVWLNFGLDPNYSYSDLEIGTYTGSASGNNDLSIWEGTAGNYYKASRVMNFNINLTLKVEPYCQFTESPGNVYMEWRSGQSDVEGSTSFSAGCSRGTAFSVSLDTELQDGIMTVENAESGDRIDLQLEHEALSGLVDCLSSGVLNVPDSSGWTKSVPFCRTRLIFKPNSSIPPVWNGEAIRSYEGTGMINLSW